MIETSAMSWKITCENLKEAKSRKTKSGLAKLVVRPLKDISGPPGSAQEFLRQLRCLKWFRLKMIFSPVLISHLSVNLNSGQTKQQPVHEKSRQEDRGSNL